MMERSTSLLPMIKCSTCSKEVPIQALSSHLCYDQHAFKLSKPDIPLTLDTSSSPPLYINKSTSTSSISLILNKFNRKRSNSNSIPNTEEPTKSPQNKKNNPSMMIPIGKGVHKSSSFDSSLSCFLHKKKKKPFQVLNKSSQLNHEIEEQKEEEEKEEEKGGNQLYRTYSNESTHSTLSPITPPVYHQHHHHYGHGHKKSISNSSSISFRTFTIYHPSPLDYQITEENNYSQSIFFPSPPDDHHLKDDSIPSTSTATTKLLSTYYNHLYLLNQQKVNCFGCKRPIHDIASSIQFDHHHNYHQHCLKCHLCRTSLKNKPYKVHDGQVYCHQDFEEYIQTKPNCTTCHETIEPHQRPTKALNQYYHAEHVTCHHCHKPIDESTTGIVQHKKKLYCRTDFNRLFLHTCQGCQKPIERESITSSDGKLKGKWHKHCFHCYQCKQPFPNHQFYVFQNQPYCRQHYHQLNKSLCHACESPIEGKCAQISLNSQIHFKYHPQCFICYICQEQVKDIYFTDKFHHIYCKVHGRQKESIISDLSML